MCRDHGGPVRNSVCERRRAHQFVSLNRLAKEFIYSSRKPGQDIFGRDVFEVRLIALGEQLGKAEVLQSACGFDIEDGAPLRVNDRDLVPGLSIEGNLNTQIWARGIELKDYLRFGEKKLSCPSL